MSLWMSCISAAHTCGSNSPNVTSVFHMVMCMHLVLFQKLLRRIALNTSIQHHGLHSGPAWCTCHHYPAHAGNNTHTHTYTWRISMFQDASDAGCTEARSIDASASETMCPSFAKGATHCKRCLQAQTRQQLLRAGRSWQCRV